MVENYEREIEKRIAYVDIANQQEEGASPSAIIKALGKKEDTRLNRRPARFLYGS